MKRTVSLLVVCLICLCSSAQLVRHPYSGNTNLYPSFPPIHYSPEDETQLDSIILYTEYYSSDSAITFKRKYDYDLDGNLFRGSSTSKKYELDIVDFNYSFNSERNLVQSVRMTPDEDYAIKTIYSYDEENRATEEEYYVNRDVSDTIWQYLGNMRITYNEDNRIKSEITYASDTSKFEYYYDDNGQLIARDLSYYYNEWMKERRREYSYDDSGNILTHRALKVNMDYILYLNYEEINTYDPEGLKTYSDKYYYMPDSSTYHISKETYTHDGEGNVIEELRQSYEDDVWVNEEKQIYEFENSSKVMEQKYYWRFNSWNPSIMFEYDYLPNGHMDKLTSYIGNESWVLVEKYYYHYSNKITSLSLPSTSMHFNCYPNPSTNLLTIHFDQPAQWEISVFTMDGKLVLQNNYKDRTDNVQLSIEDQGIYIMKIVEGGNIYTQKIVISR